MITYLMLGSRKIEQDKRLEILQQMGGDFLLSCALYKDTERLLIQLEANANASLGSMQR